MCAASDAHNIVEEVCAANDWLVRTEYAFWEASPVSFEIQSSIFPQNPERIKHLYAMYKKAIRVRITEAPSGIDRLFELCKAEGLQYRKKERHM